MKIPKKPNATKFIKRAIKRVRREEKLFLDSLSVEEYMPHYEDHTLYWREIARRLPGSMLKLIDKSENECGDCDHLFCIPEFAHACREEIVERNIVLS